MGKTINPLRYNTDKPSFDVYFRNYERVFGPLAGKKIHLLELGISQGGSLELWRDYFQSGTIAGIDISTVRLDDPTGRIHVYQGLQQDTALLDRVRRETAPDGFDIIIDDCSHIGEFTALSFWHLFDTHLKPGGLYVIEDWGTGYMRGMPDGKAYVPPGSTASIRSRLRPFVERMVDRPSVVRRPALRRVVHALMNRLVRMKFRSHMYGLVGFVKQLVDEAGMDDITQPEWGTPPARASKFSYIQVSHGQVFIAKAGDSSGPAVPVAGTAPRRRVRRAGSARRRVPAATGQKKRP
jgi:hypothetical protein